VVAVVAAAGLAVVAADSFNGLCDDDLGDSGGGGDLLVFVGWAEWEGEEALPCTSRAILLLYV
jgi:hypothetical protein